MDVNVRNDFINYVFSRFSDGTITRLIDLIVTNVKKFDYERVG